MSEADVQTSIATPSAGTSPVLIRRFAPETDTPLVPSITAMLHRAYSKQVGLGLKPLAGRQDDAVTLRRCSSGECYIIIDLVPAVVSGGTNVRDAVQANGSAVGNGLGPVIGVIILNEIESDEGPDWFSRPGVASFSQLAVDTSAQGRGIGRLLLETVEARAAERGATELALSMAEPDDDLRRFYQRHGYRIVATWKWPYTNYVSLILSKTLKVRSATGASNGR